MKILVVDDAVFMRRLISDKLKKLGHNVIEAADGYDAVEKSKSESPEVIFMDISMPEMDGITATRLIKENDGGKIVICSVLSDSKRVIEAIKAGASDYIVKPFDDDRIKKCLDISNPFPKSSKEDYLNLWPNQSKN